MVDLTTAAGGQAPPRAARRRRRWPLSLLRLVVTTHALAVFTQPVLAGQFLSGHFDFVAVHGAVAHVIALLSLTQVVAALLLKFPGRGPLWPLWMSLLVLLAEGLQVGVGYGRVLSLHVPLGVAIAVVMTTTLLGVWRIRPRDGRERPDAPVAP